jgi:hypothetical protein
MQNHTMTSVEKRINTKRKRYNELNKEVISRF